MHEPAFCSVCGGIRVTPVVCPDRTRWSIYHFDILCHLDLGEEGGDAGPGVSLQLFGQLDQILHADALVGHVGHQIVFA